MTFAKEGYRIAAIPAAAALVAAFAFGWAVACLLLLVAVLALLFFRDPKRVVPTQPRAVIAPADGRIVAVDHQTSGHRLAPQATTKISIFMSPLDVHVNRAPLAGSVEKIEHKAGKFSAAYSPNASETNESNSLLMRADDGYHMVVVQIAGWLARRIVCWVPENSQLERGERFGLIMFGSRVDVFLPPQADVLVQVGQRSTAGCTVLAEVLAEVLA